MAIRARSFWVYECHADPALFLPWEQVPAALKEDCEQHNGIPCEGGGVPGPWCADCRFGTEAEHLVVVGTALTVVQAGGDGTVHVRKLDTTTQYADPATYALEYYPLPEEASDAPPSA